MGTGGLRELLRSPRRPHGGRRLVSLARTDARPRRPQGLQSAASRQPCAFGCGGRSGSPQPALHASPRPGPRTGIPKPRPAAGRPRLASTEGPAREPCGGRSLPRPAPSALSPGARSRAQGSREAPAAARPRCLPWRTRQRCWSGQARRPPLLGCPRSWGAASSPPRLQAQWLGSASTRGSPKPRLFRLAPSPPLPPPPSSRRGPDWDVPGTQVPQRQACLRASPDSRFNCPSADKDGGWVPGAVEAGGKTSRTQRFPITPGRSPLKVASLPVLAVHRGVAHQVAGSSPDKHPEWGQRGKEAKPVGGKEGTLDQHCQETQLYRPILTPGRPQAKGKRNPVPTAERASVLCKRGFGWFHPGPRRRTFREAERMEVPGSL